MKLIEIGLVAITGGAVVVGAYQAGKQVERTWWRSALASQNAGVAATMSKLGEEASNLDEQLLKIIGDDRAKLDSAEAQISDINTRPVPAADVDGLCRPVPAHCLQRAGGGAQAASASAGGAGTAR